MSNQYYDQLLNAKFASDYETPDWYKASGLAIDQTPEKMQQYFSANPQYAEDWARITSGQKSAYSTDGSGLVRSNLASMSPEAASYYANNLPSLLAAEGFGQDPTLTYMNYKYGPSSIGITNAKNTVKTDYLRNNSWTPGGVQSGRNPYLGAQLGSGTQSYLNARGSGNSVANGYTKPAQMGQTGAQYPSSGQSGASMSFNPAMNPFAQQMSDGMAQTMAEQFQRQVQPQIASGAIAAGGFGGSRQAVLEANAANDLQQNTGQALTNLWGNMYGQGLNYDMGMQNLGLGYANLDRSINNDNLNWQMQGANFGLGLYDRMQQANQLGLQTGSQIQNTPMNYWQNFANQANSIGQGYGTSTQSGGGNPLMGAIGGAQLGNQIGNWWNANSNGFNYVPASNGYSYTYKSPETVGPQLF